MKNICGVISLFALSLTSGSVLAMGENEGDNGKHLLDMLIHQNRLIHQQKRLHDLKQSDIPFSDADDIKHKDSRFLITMLRSHAPQVSNDRPSIKTSLPNEPQRGKLWFEPQQYNPSTDVQPMNVTTSKDYYLQKIPCFSNFDPCDYCG